MDTVITLKNPYGYNRHGFAWENVPEGKAAHLDFGCHSGEFLNSLIVKGIGRLVGLDVSQDAVDRANQQFPDLEIISISETVPLPFENCLFSSITVLDVIEHVYEQNELLDELNRVLKEDGVLIVTVPGKHLFSFLDIGNYKFIFPKLHQWYYCISHSREEYDRRYVSNPDGLVGDISGKKRWHEHFSRSKLTKLLNNSGFDVVKFDGSCFFMRIKSHIEPLIQWIKPLQSLIQRLSILDAKRFKSANLFCIARKTAEKKAGKAVNLT